METYNIIISSKNRKAGDTNSSLSVKLDKDIFIAPDEECYVNMTSFHTVKSFYACQKGLNDHFQVLFKVAGDDIATEIFDRYLSEGNYDVKTLMTEIKRLTNNALFDINYDPKLNKYLYKNLFQPTIDVYIKCINSGVFFGFEDGVEYKILIPDLQNDIVGTYSDKFINISGYTSMIIKLEGEINIENTVSNIYNSTYQIDKVFGIFSLTDISPMDSIQYDNTNASSNFRYKILNDKIPQFTVKIVNEDGVSFTNMADWIMTLRFEKVKKFNRQLSDVKYLLEDIQYYIKSLYSVLDIPARVTLEDVINR